MEAFEEIFKSYVWEKFVELAATNINISCIEDARVGPCISLWQAKCLLMRALGVNVSQRHILKLLNVEIPSPAKHQLNVIAEDVFHSAKSISVPQLAPLEKHPVPLVPLSVMSTVAPCCTLDTAVSQGPSGYISLPQFATLLSTVQAERGIPCTTIAASVYRCLESPRRGYVDSASLTSAARAAKVGPSILARMPAYFAQCDDIGIGKLSTTQAGKVLQEGATVLRYRTIEDYVHKVCA